MQVLCTKKGRPSDLFVKICLVFKAVQAAFFIGTLFSVFFD